jgi:hypothetical protein
MQYLSKIDQDCPALAWTVTKKYLHQTDRAITPHRFTVNPYIAKNIPIISLNKIKQNSNPSLFKDKILIVGFIPKAPATDKSLPPVVIQAIATEQIMQKNLPTELFPAAILILLWSGFSSSAIFQQKWLSHHKSLIFSRRNFPNQKCNGSTDSNSQSTLPRFGMGG